MAIAHFEFLSDTGGNMENTETKPATDLERIQESYTNGAQAYIPAKDKATPPATQQEKSQKASTRGQQCSLALRA